ncbi:MAG: RNA 2',3'-cyclic phosphodiesterase [Candidatus Moranbacteria bacterium]|nr:RNA 2',3'-cyclic phosphodiesterase [Candidatus Moranbacteria bacterium]MDD3965102.1 RNA 2',3'-cyclic phosphodiesterase [Candidatus Moranbacteria bacterium]
MNKTRRLFVGIPLSSQLRKRLMQEMELWPKEAVLRTTEENLHVTLFFLGFVQEEEVGEMCRRVGEVCKNIESFELSFTSMTLMENAENPKMIWLTGEPSDELRSVLEKIEKAFSSFISEKKIYRPHVTLAKIKKSKWLKLETKPVLKESVLLNETVEDIAVFESLSLDGKRRYDPIDTFSLL